MRLRRVLICSAMLLGLFGFGSELANAQQGYEFGIRFNPVRFQPSNFNGFSFQQPSFRPQFGQGIQFETINFPALSSRAVRQRRNSPFNRRPVESNISYRDRGRLLAVVAQEDLSPQTARQRAEFARNRPRQENLARQGRRHPFVVSARRQKFAKPNHPYASYASQVSRVDRFRRTERGSGVSQRRQPYSATPQTTRRGSRSSRSRKTGPISYRERVAARRSQAVDVSRLNRFSSTARR